MPKDEWSIAAALEATPLPFDLVSLLEFTLLNPLVQSLTNSACNNFFEPAESTTATGEKYVKVRTEGNTCCWGLLPEEWRNHFERIDGPEEQERVLKDLSVASQNSSFPPSLRSYLATCQTLSFDRTKSDEPILAYPPRQTSSIPSTSKRSISNHSQFQQQSNGVEKLKGKAKARQTNAVRAGQSPKKEHEVVEFCRLVQDIIDESDRREGNDDDEEQRRKRGRSIEYCIDVGSGRAHLSRALAASPLDLHVLALDWSSSQKSGAERLDQIKRLAQMEPTIGSLTHRVSALDRDGVKKVLEEWPPRGINVGDGEKEEINPALLIALHACGDLTPDSIKAFVDFSRDSRPSTTTSTRAHPKAVFVGCCYNLQTPETFPLSKRVSHLLSTNTSLSSLSPHPMTLAHLRLTPQSPPTWHLNPASTKSFATATLKLAHRARLEAEMTIGGYGTKVGERKVGRVPECRDWKEYRDKAIKRMELFIDPNSVEGGCVKKEIEPIRFGEVGETEEEEEREWNKAVFLLRVFWTLRSWLGPPLETLCVLDRWLLLVEGLYEGTTTTEEKDGSQARIEMVNLFEQATGSLRNIALVVR